MKDVKSSKKYYNLIPLVSLIVLTVFISSCALNKSHKNQNRAAGKAKVSQNKKQKRHDPQRNSINHEKKNNVVMTNLATIPDESNSAVAVKRMLKVESKCSVKGQCAKLIQNKITNLWEYPKSYPKFKTILVLDLSTDGYITSIKLKRASGRRAFDDSVIKAVRQAAPFKEITYLSAVDIAEFASIELVFKR